MSKGERSLAVMNLIMSTVAAAVACAAMAMVLLEREPGSVSERASPTPEVTASEASPPAHEASTAEVTARCLPAVVNISTRRTVQGRSSSGNPFFDLMRPFFGGQNPQESQSLGSGVIVDQTGVVLTNHHVVADAMEIRVTLSDGREYHARSVGSDPESDLAVLRLESADGEALRLDSLPYGNSTELRQGDSVLAIGNPFGVGQTVTMGIVSAVGRAEMGITDYEDFIQTDAAINPGNSGGALVNLHGELIGINTAILSRTGGSHGIGFAIPSNMAQPIAESLQNEGRVTRGWLGVALQDLSPQLARSMGIRGAVQGAVVMDIQADGPAAHADLRRGDLITLFDSETIRSGRQLRSLIATRGAGTVVRITRERAAHPAELSVTLAERPGQRAGAPLRTDSDGVSEVAGLSLAPLTEALRRRYSIDPDVRGVVVVATEEGRPGPASGIQVGDVIVQAAGQPVPSPEAFAGLYGSSFFVTMVQIRRGGASRVFFVGQ